MATLVRGALDDAISDAEIRSNGSGRRVMALDAGCGRISLLRPFRERIERLVGVDVHAPAEPLPHLDEFRLVDLCGPRDAFPPGTFDVVLSSFTIEHLAEPGAAFANIREWLAPGGVLIATTVNRRHPFVAAYLGLPTRLRRVLQPVVKSSAADAHPLVGACNDPGAIADALGSAGFREVRLTTVGHLARAWGRHWPTFVLGLTGDVLTRDAPTRRSTIVAVARA